MFSRGRSSATCLSIILALLCCACAQSKYKYRAEPSLTPLMKAAAHKDLARVRELLTRGANVNQKTAAGETALYEAIERHSPYENHLPIVDALLGAGADPNEQEIFDASAFSISLTRQYANSSVTLRLLEAGARVPECGEGEFVALSRDPGQQP